jgi:hypothetical protein
MAAMNDLFIGMGKSAGKDPVSVSMNMPYM